jgi:serine phosphatase RsbU (regulator of sigma subunit)
MYEIQIAAAKVNKYASRESGDTLEIVERPGAGGGFTAVLADGQGSGRAAKTISNLVVAKCVTLIKDGVRDGVVARAANENLFAYRHGQVSATLNLLTVDFSTKTLVITSNNPQPAFIVRPPEAEETEFQLITVDSGSTPIGIYSRSRPFIREIELLPGMWAIAITDGVTGAGTRYNEQIDLPAAILHLTKINGITAQNCADAILELAIKLDRNRPTDDMSVMVLSVREHPGEDGDPLPRRLSLSVPFQF